MVHSSHSCGNRNRLLCTNPRGPAPLSTRIDIDTATPFSGATCFRIHLLQSAHHDVFINMRLDANLRVVMRHVWGQRKAVQARSIDDKRAVCSLHKLGLVCQRTRVMGAKSLEKSCGMKKIQSNGSNLLP